jgi:hypothetical protein
MSNDFPAGSGQYAGQTDRAGRNGLDFARPVTYKPGVDCQGCGQIRDHMALALLLASLASCLSFQP